MVRGRSAMRSDRRSGGILGTDAAHRLLWVPLVQPPVQLNENNLPTAIANPIQRPLREVVEYVLEAPSVIVQPDGTREYPGR